MSEALLLLAREDGAGVSRSQAPPWKTSEQEMGGVSSLWDEWRIRDVRDVSVIGGSSRSGRKRSGISWSRKGRRHIKNCACRHVHTHTHTHTDLKECIRQKLSKVWFFIRLYSLMLLTKTKCIHSKHPMAIYQATTGANHDLFYLVLVEKEKKKHWINT